MQTKVVVVRLQSLPLPPQIVAIAQQQRVQVLLVALRAVNPCEVPRLVLKAAHHHIGKVAGAYLPKLGQRRRALGPYPDAPTLHGCHGRLLTRTLLVLVQMLALILVLVLVLVLALALMLMLMLMLSGALST